MSVRCLILEDQAPARRVLQNYLERLPGFEIVASVALPSVAAGVLDAEPVDLLFLDLGLPQQDGFAFLARRAEPPVVIVTTAFGERALEGFEHGVVDYLVKPFSFARFERSLERARLALRARGDDTIISVPVDRGRKEFVATRDVVSLSADGDYVIIRTVAGRLYTLGPLALWLDRLPTPPFVRIHRSHAVNRDHVSGAGHRSVAAGGEELPVSATYARALKAMLEQRP